MIRISDILKKDKEKRKILPDIGKEEGMINLPEDPKDPDTDKNHGINISNAVGKSYDLISDKEIDKLYYDVELIAREMYNEKLDYAAIDIKKITLQIEEIVELLIKGNERLLTLSLTRDSIADNYLICHLVNSCILSVKVGIGLGYKKDKLLELGVASFLHDVGMVKYTHLAILPRKLSTKEFDEIKRHSRDGLEMLKKIKDLSKIITDVAYQHHERINSTGYPEGLNGEHINEYAKILGLVDVYEAMIHPRTYREALVSLEAIKEILNDKKAFEYKLIKILIEDIGLFPAGSFVELNTKEIAEVVKTNRRIPLRPSVRIMYSPAGKRLEKGNVIELAVHPSVWITREVTKNELNS